jgi:hypothetical protein
MSMILDTFARAAFKRLVGKSHTTNSRDPANEPFASSYTLSAQTIWAEKIHPTPLDSSNEGIVSGLLTLVLEPVSGTANSGKYAAYRTKLGGTVPASLFGKINRKTGAEYAANDYVGDIIPQSFGVDFAPRLFKGAVETPPLDASDWFVDASAGVVTQEEDSPSYMVDYSTTGTLQCYVYVGSYVADSLNGIVAGATQFYDYQTIGSGITGDMDGVNTVFTLSRAPAAGSVHLFLNGLLTRDFTISGNQITVGASSLPLLVAENEMYVNYRV